MWPAKKTRLQPLRCAVISPPQSIRENFVQRDHCDPTADLSESALKNLTKSRFSPCVRPIFITWRLAATHVASAIVVVNHRLECGKAAIVHVRGMPSTLRRLGVLNAPRSLSIAVTANRPLSSSCPAPIF